MGVTVVDSGVLIALMDGADLHHAAARAALTDAIKAHQLVLPASAYAEAMVFPNRLGPEAALRANAFIDELPARVEPATREIAASAAELRARHGPKLKLPDALVIATAHVIGADRIITMDAAWPKTRIPVDVVGTGR